MRFQWLRRWARFYGEYNRRYHRSLPKTEEPAPLGATAFGAVADHEPQQRLAPHDFFQDRLFSLARDGFMTGRITKADVARYLATDLAGAEALPTAG